MCSITPLNPKELTLAAWPFQIGPLSVQTTHKHWRLPVEKLPKLRCRHYGWLDHVDSSHQWQITTTLGTSISRRIIYSFNCLSNPILKICVYLCIHIWDPHPQYQIKLQHRRCNRVIRWIILSITPGSQRSSDPAQLRNLRSTTDVWR